MQQIYSNKFTVSSANAGLVLSKVKLSSNLLHFWTNFQQLFFIFLKNDKSRFSESMELNSFV